MTARVRGILEARWKAAKEPLEGWVWPAETKSGHIEPSSLKKQHRKALKLAKIRPFVLYSPRHTFLTRLGTSGYDVWTLARIAGHSSAKMLMRTFTLQAMQCEPQWRGRVGRKLVMVRKRLIRRKAGRNS